MCTCVPHDVYNAKKKSYTVICQEKISNQRSGGKILTQTKSPISPSLTKVKWADVCHHVVVFKTNVLHFKIENTPIKDTSGKRKFKRELKFLFMDKRELFAMKLSCEEFNFVFFTVDQSAWLVLNYPARRGYILAV